MEEKFRRKALARLVALILVFCAFLAYLSTFEPERVQVLGVYRYDWPELDGANVTLICEKLNSPDFMENYTVEMFPGGYDIARITPKNDIDVEVTFYDYQGDLNLNADGYMSLHPLRNDGDYEKLADRAAEHLSAVAAHIGYPIDPETLHWDDNDFATWPYFWIDVVFFALLAAIATYGFMFAYRKGWLLENYRVVPMNSDVLVGLGFIYCSAGLGLFMLRAMAYGAVNACVSGCLVVDFIFLVAGVYAINYGMHKYFQSPPAR
jgi:hypothetical protein